MTCAQQAPFARSWRWWPSTRSPGVHAAAVRRPCDPLAGRSAGSGLASRQRPVWLTPRAPAPRGAPIQAAGGAPRSAGRAGPEPPPPASTLCKVCPRPPGVWSRAPCGLVHKAVALAAPGRADSHSGRPPRGGVLQTFTGTRGTMELSTPVDSASDGRRHRGARPPKLCGGEWAPARHDYMLVYAHRAVGCTAAMPVCRDYGGDSSRNTQVYVVRT